MTIDITGITNENEFYTHHYLSAILENDLKEIFQLWKQREDDEDIPQPHALLRALRKDFFARQGLLERERDIEERLNIQREFTGKLLSTLGYEYYTETAELDDDSSIPLIGAIRRADGTPELWIIEVFDVPGEESDPLELYFSAEQYPPDDEIAKVLDISAEEIITKQVFGRSEPPRWVILVSDKQMILLDRTKWHDKRLLRFDLREILDRREASTLQAMAALLHKDSICPQDGMPLLDTLDENSHKHAFAVSEDLKYSLREAIELLGNEAVYYLREHLHEKIYERDMAGQLTRECLRYMYRLLFLFYIEARPELGYLPYKSREYRKGYSLETLRDLELVKLTTDESKNGFFLHESIKMLFNLLYDGFQPSEKSLFASPDHDTFRISPLRSHLFDPKQTPLLNRVKLRNIVLQRIIELMSLSRPAKGKKSRRGRISYSQLGINQLGAVYEALLSYQGFFAESDLYEVKKAGEKHNVLETAYFVKPEDLEQYTEDERVYNDDGTLVKFERGTFIYRLAGRDREKSASYYTPEVLTQCLVKYALKELLKDRTADDILELTVCEPAMGSAAFLNEAVNQLAKAYLDLKQKEIGQTISHDEYPKELQKVKMYIADNNVYGVDLNPVAVELAEVSLWLNTIFEGGFVPWFGNQLVCGNSLIGARRQVFHESLLKKQNRTDTLWLDEVPKQVMPGDKRDNDTVYHFLLPDKGMADYKDKVIKKMAADEIKAINEWRKEFTKPFTKSEIEQLKKLSDAVDKLWEKHVEMQRHIEKRTSDPLHVFGQKEPDGNRKPTTTEFKDKILHQELYSKNVRSSSPYRRLKLVMDYWCALWFWPIQKADQLPSRAEFLFDLTLILEGNVFESDVDESGQKLLFPDTQSKQQSKDMLDKLGYVNVDKLCRDNERLGLVEKLAGKFRYLHWELAFADLFASQGGFDLILGNPPWIRVEWKESELIGEIDPIFVFRPKTPEVRNKTRTSTISKYNLLSAYLNEYSSQDGMKKYLTANNNNPSLKGQKANLYKCFLSLTWSIAKKNGVSALLHPEGVYEDPNGGDLRSGIYSRLAYHFQFQNELKLFSDVHNNTKYSINIYAAKKNFVSFYSISNLFHPTTITRCFNHLGGGVVPGLKNNNTWDLSGHKSRILYINDDDLKLFSDLYDEENTPQEEARFPSIHANELKTALNKIASFPQKLQSINHEYFSTGMWNETYCQEDGIISRDIHFPNSELGWVISGPHFFVGNLYNKTPRKNCLNNKDYDCIDLTNIPPNYLPRSNYRVNINEIEKRNPIPLVKWNKNDRKLGSPITDFYRLLNREMISSTAERTLVSTIIPKGPANLKSCVASCFKNNKKLLDFAGMSFSLPIDSFVKSTGLGHANVSLINKLPIAYEESYIVQIIRMRVLLLVCITTSFEKLWKESWIDEFGKYTWAKSDVRLPNRKIHSLTKNWNYNTPLRTYFERRHALVEIDVLNSMLLGLNLEELISIYQLQFPVMRQYESDTWYDQTGRIIFTISKGLTGVGFSRPEWNKIKEMKSGTVERTITDDTLPGGPIVRTITYEAPFDRCDREKDYEVVWTEFERRFKNEG